MKILILFCLFIGLSRSGKGRPDEFCYHQCDFADYVALVKCSTGECKCFKLDDNGVENANVPCTTEVAGKPSLTWEECQNLAGTIAADDVSLKNEYFRWEKKDDGYCYLLLECHEMAGDCGPGVPDTTCVSGPSGEGKCNPEVEAEGVCEQATWEAKGLHWTCLFDNQPINPYIEAGADPVKLPVGTTCDTWDGMKECSGWKWSDDAEHSELNKIARVKCDKDAGKWISTIEYGVDGVLTLLTNENPPASILPNESDAVCNCETLMILQETIDTHGFSLICDEGFQVDIGIVSDNSCALLCDGHFKMFIECYKGTWMDTANYPFTEKTLDDIKC